MQNRRFIKFLTIILSLISPVICFADSAHRELADSLLKGYILILICMIVTIVGIVKFLKKRDNLSFALAFIPSFLLYIIFCNFISRDPLSRLWLLPPLAIMFFLLSVKIREKSTMAWQYSAMNITTVSIALLVLDALWGNIYSNSPMRFLTYNFSSLSYMYFTFLLSKSVLQQDYAIKVNSIFVKINLFIVLSQVLEFFYSYQKGYFLSRLINHSGNYIVHLLLYIGMCNLMALITIKIFGKKNDKKQGIF